MKEEKKELILVLIVAWVVLAFVLLMTYDEVIKEPRKAMERERDKLALKYLESEAYVPLGWTFERAPATSAEELEVLSSDSNILILGSGATTGEILILPEEGADYEGQILTIDDSSEVFDLQTVGVTDAEWAVSVPITKIIIEDDNGEDIGVLDWSTGKFEFRGKMSSSARSFFKYFLKPYVDEYIAGLSYEEARELEWGFPTAGRTFMFRNMTWPITQTLSIREFIEWLYENDYEIRKKEGK